MGPTIYFTWGSHLCYNMNVSITFLNVSNSSIEHSFSNITDTKMMFFVMDQCESASYKICVQGVTPAGLGEDECVQGERGNSRNLPTFHIGTINFNTNICVLFIVSLL